MKVAMVSMNAGPLACLGGVEGGAQTVVIDSLSRALTSAGHTVDAFPRHDAAALPGCLANSASATPLDAISGFADHLEAAWRVDRPDVVHAHSWAAGKAAVAAARAMGIPVVQTFHGLARTKRMRGEPANSMPWRAIEEAALIRSVARIVATSSTEVFALLGLGANPKAIKLIPCGVDLGLFGAGERPVPVTRSPFRVATLSRLVPDTGVADVIDALGSVADVELAIGGGFCAAHDIATDPDARALAARAAERGVAHRVTFRGNVKRDEVAEFLRAADLVVCAPWYDSVGTVALEAMACGVPVIVSAVGGHLDAVADGISGLHVLPRAPRQIAYAIDALRADPAQRARFSRFGIERTSARYGWARIAAETLDVYASVARAPQLSGKRG